MSRCPFLWYRRGTLVDENLGSALPLILGKFARIFVIFWSGSHCPFDCWPIADLIHPTFYIWEFFKVNLSRFPPGSSGVTYDVGNRIFARRQILFFVKPQIHDSIKAVNFIIETSNRIGLISVCWILRRAREVTLFP